MPPDQEQEAFSLVIDRHRSGDTENDIRLAFIRFMETAGIAGLAEMTTEGPPGVGNPGRMDLYVHNTCIEFKTDILRSGAPNPDDVGQLDGYIENLLRAGSGVRNGILTDGVHYFLRRVGEEKLPLQRGDTHRTFDRPEQAPRLREYLHGIISAPAENVSPTADNLERQFGSGSDVFQAANLLLQDAYATHRDDPHRGRQAPAVAGFVASGAGQGRRHGRRRKRLAVHQAHLHHRPDCRHHAAATPGRRGSPRRRTARRAAQRAHPGRRVRPARHNRRRPVHLAHGGGRKRVPAGNRPRGGAVRLDGQRPGSCPYPVPERHHPGGTQAAR